MTYAFNPEKIRFDTETIERIKAFELDPEGKIKAHTENISSALGEENVKKVLVLLNETAIKHLLYSVGTRLGMFIPTIETLTRIYLGLRKKEALNAGDRNKIQDEILMKYKKAAYSEEMGKKARNLALNYFIDYLHEFGLRLYKDRFKNIPEGQNNIESHYRRHETIKSFCCDMIKDRSAKVAMSTQAIQSIQDRFSDSANQFIKETIGAQPDDI